MGNDYYESQEWRGMQLRATFGVSREGVPSVDSAPEDRDEYVQRDAGIATGTEPEAKIEPDSDGLDEEYQKFWSDFSF